MNSLFIIFTVIVLVNAKPTEYSDQYEEEDTNVSDDSDEKTIVAANYPTGVFTKYPDDPYDNYNAELPVEERRIRRQSDRNETDPSIDVSKQADKSADLARSERKTEEHPKVPLRSFISFIESDLVSKALDVNSQLRRRRSTEQILDKKDDDDSHEDENDDDDKNEKSEKNKKSEDEIDVNKDFFGGIFNYTRPQRETEEKDVKIPLNGLIQAVESTFVHSAQNLKESSHRKRDVSDVESCELNKFGENSDEKKPKKEAEIKVQKLAPSNNVNLNLLSPIAFKSAPVAPATTESSPNSSEEEGVSTTEVPIQKTDLTVLQAHNSVHLVPGADKKLAHVQHQEISKTVFHSNLAIFPTIPPQSINAPLPHITTTEQSIDTTLTPHASKTEQETKHEQLLQKANKLKEKFAEIQAEPVILSQF